MNENFKKALEFVLKWEGGYSNDPNDPGGETNFGISKRSHPDLDIKALTKEQASMIYFQKYWLPISVDLPYPLDMVAFDTAVNCGMVRAKNWIQNNDYKEVLLLRIWHYVQLAQKDQFKGYLRGWMNRVMDLWGEISQDA